MRDEELNERARVAAASLLESVMQGWMRGARRTASVLGSGTPARPKLSQGLIGREDHNYETGRVAPRLVGTLDLSI